ARIVVGPVGPVPHVHAPLCPRPETPRGIEFQKINNSIGAGSLNRFLYLHHTGHQADTVDTAPMAITDPHFAIRASPERNNFLIAQTIGARIILPTSGHIPKKPVGTSGPHRAICSFCNRPEARGG